MKSTFQLSFLFFTLTAWLLLFSCSQKEEESEEINAGILDPFEERIQLLNIGLQQVPKWTTFWKSKGNNFSSDQFIFSKEVPFESFELPETNFITEDHPFHDYLIVHPEGLGVVDIYSYKVTLPESGGVAINPDSEAIFFKANGMRERLLFMGPSGGFEDAKWLSPDLLMVTGFFEYEDGFAPKIWFVSISESTYHEFDHPFRTSNYDRIGYLKDKLKNVPF